MPTAGKARVGHAAPHFECNGYVDGEEQTLSLDYFAERKQWVILCFLPATFSVVCVTEVLAFDQTVEEFHERNCAVVFVSTDSKHSLWQWQQIPKQNGGLGRVNVPLMSDQSHQMSRDYGVLVETKGMALRGTYVIDPHGIIQHQTIQSVVVGRSVLETLRLLEAFQVAARRGQPKMPSLQLATTTGKPAVSPSASGPNPMPEVSSASKSDETLTNRFATFRMDSPSAENRKASADSDQAPPAAASSVAAPSSPRHEAPPVTPTLSIPQMVSALRKDSVVFNFADPLSMYDRVGTPKPVYAKQRIEEAVEPAPATSVQRTMEALKRISSGLSPGPRSDSSSPDRRAGAAEQS